MELKIRARVTCAMGGFDETGILTTDPEKIFAKPTALCHPLLGKDSATAIRYLHSFGFIHHL